MASRGNEWYRDTLLHRRGPSGAVRNSEKGSIRLSRSLRVFTARTSGEFKQARNGTIPLSPPILLLASDRASSMMLRLPPSINGQEGCSERQTIWQGVLSSQRLTANPQSSPQTTSDWPLPKSFDQQTPGRHTRLGPYNLKNRRPVSNNQKKSVNLVWEPTLLFRAH